MSELRPHTLPVFRLGKHPVKLDDRTLQFSKYRLTAPSPIVVPDEVSWDAKVPSWPMYGNDVLGDCVPAAMGHSVEQWTTYASGTGALFPDSTIISAYSAISGYVPGDPATDNGCVMLDALNYWRQTGIGDHTILAFVAVNPSNLAEVKEAIYLFGNLFIGLQLPISAQGYNRWTVPDEGLTGNGAPGSWGGHCVPVVAMSPQTLTAVTWGNTLKMSHNFFHDYVDEAYAVISDDWISADGMSPGHQFNLQQLMTDLQAITGE